MKFCSSLNLKTQGIKTYLKEQKTAFFVFKFKNMLHPKQMTIFVHEE